MMFCVNNNKYVTNTCNIGNIAMLLAFTLCGGIVITANVCSAYQSFIVNNNNTATPGVAMYYHDITNGNRNNTKSVGLMYQDAMYDSSSGAFVGINQGYSLSTNQLNFTTNEVFFLTDDSVISVVNNIFILSATGNYQKYTGGTLDWKVIQLDPDYVSKITVTAPRDDDD